MEERPYLVEFLTLAAILVMALASLVLLTAVNASSNDDGLRELLRTTVTTILGALVALAYAARGQRPEDKKDDENK